VKASPESSPGAVEAASRPRHILGGLAFCTVVGAGALLWAQGGRDMLEEKVQQEKAKAGMMKWKSQQEMMKVETAVKMMRMMK